MPEHQDAVQFAPPASEEEARVALQFVRKLSGFTRPSKVNEVAFDRAVDEVAAAARALLASLVTSAAPRDRATETAKLRARSASRFDRSGSARGAADAATSPGGGA